mgnify:CR=1 FL=1
MYHPDKMKQRKVRFFSTLNLVIQVWFVVLIDEKMLTQSMICERRLHHKRLVLRKSPLSSLIHRWLLTFDVEEVFFFGLGYESFAGFKFGLPLGYAFLVRKSMHEWCLAISSTIMYNSFPRLALYMFDVKEKSIVGFNT